MPVRHAGVHAQRGLAHERTWRLATNPASKIVSADNLLVAPDEQMLLVHIVLPEEQTGNAPRVGFAPEETLSTASGIGA